MMYQIGTFHGVAIMAAVNDPTDANALSALFKAAIESKWEQAYADAYHALRELNQAVGDQISEYEPLESTQRVLWLNGQVHSIDGWDVMSPLVVQSPDGKGK